MIEYHNRSLILLLICALSCFLKVGAQEIPDDTEYFRLVERADSAVNVAEYEEALELLQSAMRLEPANPMNVMLLSNSGMLQFYIGRDSLAMATLDLAHEMAPQSVTVLLNRARVNGALGRQSQALDDYTQIISMDSTLLEPYVQRAMLQLRGGDIRGAEQSLDRAETIDDKSVDVWVSRALLFSKTNRPAEALPYLNKLIKKDPQSEYYAERAMCRLRVEDFAGASEDIGEGLLLDNDNPDLYVARALLNKRRFREKDAQADAIRALDRGAPAAYVKALGFQVPPGYK